MGQIEHKIGLFADDVMLYLQDLDTSLPNLLEVIEQFYVCFGYKLNIPKTQIIHFNYSIGEEIKTLKYLGIIITTKPDLLYKGNYKPINNNIKKYLEWWSTYPLDFSRNKCNKK